MYQWSRAAAEEAEAKAEVEAEVDAAEAEAAEEVEAAEAAEAVTEDGWATNWRERACATVRY